jgi:hypothetical protein
MVEVSVGRFPGNMHGGLFKPVLKLLDSLDVVADRGFGKSFQLKK